MDLVNNLPFFNVVTWDHMIIMFIETQVICFRMTTLRLRAWWVSMRWLWYRIKFWEEF